MAFQQAMRDKVAFSQVGKRVNHHQVVLKMYIDIKIYSYRIKIPAE